VEVLRVALAEQRPLRLPLGNDAADAVSKHLDDARARSLWSANGSAVTTGS
jgi:hypothetical protein